MAKMYIPPDATEEEIRAAERLRDRRRAADRDAAGYFLVRGHEGGEPVTVRVHVDRGFLASLGVTHADGLAVVDVTLAYLLGHQRLDELPPEVDLEEVIAAYPAFEPLLREHLRGRA